MYLQNLNALRSISIVCIIVGHGCLQLGQESLGRFCGYLFVQIFFLMSAFLLGLKYGDSKLSKEFLIKRWKRLSVVYYPYLFISIGIMMTLGEIVSVKNVLTHFLYVNYFLQDNLCGITFGHLWYLSMMMLCYVLLAIVYRFPKTSQFGLLWDKLTHGKGLFLLIMITFVYCLVCLKFHVPCRIPIVLVSYLVLFKRAKDVYIWLQNWKNRIFSAFLFIISNSICLILFLYWNLNDKLLPRDIIVLVTACCWIIYFMTCLRDVTCGKILNFLSAISFELYLVHHPFILGDYSWLNSTMLFGNVLINGVFAIAVIISLAYVLKKTGQVFFNIQNK